MQFDRQPSKRRSTTRHMCGVYAAVSKHNAVRPSGYLSSCLDRRGPDHTSTVHLSANLSDASIHLTFSSNVLALRGDHVARQPLVDEESGSVLCWNGEAWKINERSVRGNDAEAVLALLLEASHRGDGIIHVLEALRAIKGPFALVYYDKRKEHIFYGRDRLGRRSLLVSAGEPFVLSSVAENPDAAWLEVEADGCYTLDLKKPGGHLVPSRYAWADDEALVSPRARALQPSRFATYLARCLVSVNSTYRPQATLSDWEVTLPRCPTSAPD